jgi:uncharacterized Rmd1/YagE family protein
LKFVEVRVSDDVQDVGKQQFTAQRMVLFTRFLTVVILQHNIRFLQEILQNRKSDFLEWLIIILISVEILISVYNIVHEQM